MHCNCCDKQLSEKEIIWNPEIDNWELCTTCLDVAMETAYSQGFNIEDDEDIYVLDEGFDYGYDDLLPRSDQRWPY